MRFGRLCWVFLIAIGLTTACSPKSDKNTLPTLVIEAWSPERQAQLCAEVEAAWNTDWPRVIQALEALARNQAECMPDQPSAGKLYAAHFNYGSILLGTGDEQGAGEEFYAALEVVPQGREALAALQSLSLPTPTPLPLASCSPNRIREASVAIPDYQASGMPYFVEVQGRGFAANGIAFVPRGINYFPMHYPWRRFLTEADLETVRTELTMLRETGFNSLRIFLWHEALFQCPGSGAVPIPEAFARLDSFIQEAAAQGFRMIVTLHDLPDLLIYPLYSDPAYTRHQMEYIVARYRDETAIMAWDVRNEGDIDVRRNDHLSQEGLLAWLEETTALVRSLDANHLITAGWLRDELTTEPFVDFVSFHYWSHPDDLEDRLRPTLEGTEKPVLLEEFGYSTFNVPPESQAKFLNQSIDIAEAGGVAGWLIWAAFDFPLEATCVPPACPSEDNAEHHFGLWDTTYTPKPAVEILTQRLAP
jgi:hypothetical protein